MELAQKLGVYAVYNTSMPSWRGRLTLSVNAPAAGSMPLGPPQRMHGSVAEELTTRSPHVV